MDNESLKFKEMYGEICDSDWFKKSIFSLFEKLFIVQYCNVNYFFEFLIENTYLLKIDWNPKGTYNLIACYVSFKFSWNSGYQKLFIVKYYNLNYFSAFSIIFYILKQNQMFFAKYQKS